MEVFNGIKIRNKVGLGLAENVNEYNQLIDSIDLGKIENYNCSILNVWSYRRANDIRDGINLRFGNMCNGFPFEIEGVRFHNSECAYIAGAYAGSHPAQLKIQEFVAGEKNGLKCKRIYRRRPEFTVQMRNDFYTYNTQWMIYILWQKCLQNKQFSDLLARIPLDAHVVENTSFHKGAASIFWGAKNRELTIARMDAEKKVTEKGGFKFKKDLVLTRMQASNAINNIGCFVGKNVMGKIIKICSLSLQYGKEPPIDYSWLKSRNLAMYGKMIDFR